MEADHDTLRQVEDETWARWGITQNRVALLDLVHVNAYFADRREAWSRKGVQVVTGPQYRVWRDNEIVGIATALPADRSLTDGFLVGLESNTADATVIVHDSGTCSVHLHTDTAEEDWETLFGLRRHTGRLDLDGVADVFEKAVSALVGGAET